MSVVPTATLDEPTLTAFTDEFFREGGVLIPSILTTAEVTALRTKTDDYAADPNTASKHLTMAGNAFVLRYCHELDPLFQAMTTHPTIMQVVKAVLGNDARFNALNVIRNGPGQAIARWHVDDVLEFALPPEIARFDARIRMPVLWMTVQVALSDIDSEEHGPTQFVPKSHYSGRKPPEVLEFEGQGPTSVFCKAGDIYLTNHQTWHRGAPNRSDRVRYIMQLQYAVGWADRRFRGVA
ncbi:MAG: phytanoyl-CoA dioxygenase family protein [Caldilineaceae bacterium]|nr:phytanoyl-CoA dioxygenase family protein [Caldilineaceae bacterium]